MRRSSQSRNRHEPVNEHDSRPLLSLATAKVTSVSGSRPPRKSQPLSEPQSSLPNSPSYRFDEATGAQTLVSHIRFQRKSQASAVQSLSDLSLLHEVLALSHRLLSSVSYNLLVCKMPTHLLPVLQRPWRTLSRLLSWLLVTHMVS